MKYSIKSLIEDYNINRSKLAEILDISRNTLYTWIVKADEGDIDIYTTIFGAVNKLVRLPDNIVNDVYANNNIFTSLKRISINDTHNLTETAILDKINLYPIITEVYAGMPNLVYKDQYEQCYFNYAKKEGCFFVRIKGDSMYPTLKDGDLAFVDTNAPIRDNDIVAGRLINGEQFIKRYTKVNDHAFVLTSDNIALYKPLSYGLSELDVIYKVVRSINNYV